MRQQKINQLRISLVAGTILIVVAILVGVMVFYVMERHTENLLRQNLQISLQNHVDIAQSEIRGGFEKGLTVATRPLLINQIEYANTHSGDNATLPVLTKAAQSFLSTGLTAISFFDAEGKEVAHAGAFLQKSALSVPVNTAGHTQILFSTQFFCARM